MKKALRETQTLRAGCSKAEPKIFALSQTPFPGAQDGQNLISWRWSLPSPTDQVWWKSMHAISSYHGNSHCPPAVRPPATDRTDYNTLRRYICLARSVIITGKENTMCEKFFHLYNREHNTRGHCLKLATTSVAWNYGATFSVIESSHTGTSYLRMWSRQTLWIPSGIGWTRNGAFKVQQTSQPVINKDKYKIKYKYRVRLRKMLQYKNGDFCRNS